MNAIREIPTAKEVEVLLQTNEVFVHLPKDTVLSDVPQAIYEAGYAPDENIWVQARGSWTARGFLPEGWEIAIPVAGQTEAEGLWQLHFVNGKDGWTFREAEPLKELPVVEDEEV